MAFVLIESVIVKGFKHSKLSYRELADAFIKLQHAPRAQSTSSFRVENKRRDEDDDGDGKSHRKQFTADERIFETLMPQPSDFGENQNRSSKS
jgi:hypothetical protein